MSDHHSETTDDLSALAWVQEELRRSLESAHKALRRFIKDAEAVSGSDVDAVDPAVLRTAHQQIHQGVGALELVAYRVTSGGERLPPVVQRTLSNGLEVVVWPDHDIPNVAMYTWFRAGGWSLEHFDQRTGPTAEALDRVVGHRPAFLPSNDHHVRR